MTPRGINPRWEMVGTGAIKCLTVLCAATGLGASGLGPAAIIPQQNPHCWDRDGVGELLFPPGMEQGRFLHPALPRRAAQHSGGWIQGAWEGAAWLLPDLN